MSTRDVISCHFIIVKGFQAAFDIARTDAGFQRGTHSPQAAEGTARFPA